MASSQKQHVSIVVCGHVDAGKSTTTGHLIFELGGISEREMSKLKEEAIKLGKPDFTFAFVMDRQSESRRRGVTITSSTMEFFTESKHYTVVDAPGHRDFIKNMLTGASQADVALLMVPADGNFASAIARGDHKTGEIQGQTRQHAVLVNLLGVKQLLVAVNKMDCDVAKYSQTRFDEVKNEVKEMLWKAGWKKEFVENHVPIIPISGWIGDNLIKPSTNMSWWTGVDVKTITGDVVHVHTILDVLDKVVIIPPRATDKPMRMPVSGVTNVKGFGDVITGRVEQGKVEPGSSVIFLPTHSALSRCSGRIFSIEMHHKSIPVALAGDNVGILVKDLNKSNMPRPGDVMVLSSDQTIQRVGNFTTQVQVLSHPGELKVGYTPVGFVRTSRSALKIIKINWKLINNKEAGHFKSENPVFIKANDVAEIVFEPQQQFVVETFKNCEGLGRVAIMEGNQVVMLGKIISVEYKSTN